MHNYRKINNDLYYIGANDRKISLFESVYPVLDGVSYNSYLLKDDKTVLFDTVDKHERTQFFENLEAVLGDKPLDYLLINHLEPDHSALIKDVIEKYNNIKIICNQKIKDMLFQFFELESDKTPEFVVVKEGDVINTGNHELTFVMAPMVHWPEVMVTYDKTDKTLFSADAFGSFGALDGNIFDNEVQFNEKISEYRRYYTNIVGKYGLQVNNLLNKAKNLEIKTICPLHGLILRENISYLVEKYSLWANYKPEINSVLIAYSSVYGATQNAAEILASKLAQMNVKNIKVYDVSKTHSSYVLSDAFKYSHIVLATTTYNNNIFVTMEHFINDLIKHNLGNRTFALIENGSWAPNCACSIINELKDLKGTRILDNKVTLKSTLKTAQESELDNLAKLIFDDIQLIH